LNKIAPIPNGLRYFSHFFSAFSPPPDIHVDITPENSTNRFRPNETLGAGVDRIPAEAIDNDLVQPNLGRALASGWQPVTYRRIPNSPLRLALESAGHME